MVLREPRPCAVCQITRVYTDLVCEKCRKVWGNHLDEPWAKWLLQESDAQARLTRQKKHEAPLTVAEN